MILFNSVFEKRYWYLSRYIFYTRGNELPEDSQLENVDDFGDVDELMMNEASAIIGELEYHRCALQHAEQRAGRLLLDAR